MILIFIVTFCTIVALGFGAASAWSDVNRLIIPNLYSILIIAAFIPAFLFVNFLAPDSSYFASWKSHAVALVIVFSITYAMFYFGVFGGGDAKLISAFSLWAGVAGLIPLLFFTALGGALVSIATLALRKWKPVKKTVKDSWIEKAQQGENKVPYGVAIFVGALVSFWQVGYIQPESIAQLAAQSMGVQ